jgi:hypothetical protein
MDLSFWNGNLALRRTSALDPSQGTVSGVFAGATTAAAHAISASGFQRNKDNSGANRQRETSACSGPRGERGHGEWLEQGYAKWRQPPTARPRGPVRPPQGGSGEALREQLTRIRLTIAITREKNRALAPRSRIPPIRQHKDGSDERKRQLPCNTLGRPARLRTTADRASAAASASHCLPSISASNTSEQTGRSPSRGRRCGSVKR